MILLTSAHNEPKLYEIVSGHRRVYAARMAGLKEVPVVIKKMTDEEAVIAMVDSNMQRENILPSEGAYSLKMKYDAMKKQGKRSDITLDHFEPKLSAKELGEVFDMSAAQIKRYIKITDLIPGLMDYMDTKYINLAVGYALSFIDEDSQMVIYNYLQKGNKLNSKQANNLKVYNEGGTPIKEGEVEVLISDPKPKRQFILSSKKIKEYFPDSMSEKDIESIIMDLLEKWKNGRED
jgi:ParB family chromosome partitioning protein